MPRPADRRAKTELLRAAEAVFVERGLAAAKVEDITGRAGVSKGAFYLHFESKDDCWRQIVEAFLARMSGCLRIPDPTGVPTLEIICNQLDEWLAHDIEMFEFTWQNRALLGMLLAGGGGAPYGYLVDQFAEQVGRKLQAWAQMLIDAGIYRDDVDPALLTALISGGYDRMAREVIKQSKRPDLASWCRQAQQFFLRASFTDEARAIIDRGVRSGLSPRAEAADLGQLAERSG